MQSKINFTTLQNTNRRRRNTEEMDARLCEILADEHRKDSVLGHGHKQKLTNKQVHKFLTPIM